MQSFGMKGVYATGNYRRLALSSLPLNFPARLSQVSGAEPMKHMFSSKRLQDGQQFTWKNESLLSGNQLAGFTRNAVAV